MLEFTLLTWNSENYNIMNQALAGNIDHVLLACGSTIPEVSDWTTGSIRRL